MSRGPLSNLCRGDYYSLSLSPVRELARCGLAGDQRWTDFHLAAAPRGTAASARFGASSVGSLPPPFTTSLLSVARDISVLPLALNPLSLPPSLSGLACTPASRRASRFHLSPPLCTPYRRSTSITDAVRPSLAVLHLVLPLTPSSSLLFSSHIPSAPSATTPFSLHPAARSVSRSRSRSTLGGPHPRIGVAWYTMRYDLLPLPLTVSILSSL